MEKLFLLPHQGEVFLSLLGAGVLLGALLQVCTLLRRRFSHLAPLWDALFALGLGGLLLVTLLRWRESQLRLYAFLGIIVGSLLYIAGIGSLLARLGTFLGKKRKAQEEKASPSAGKAPPRGEFLSSTTGGGNAHDA